MAETWALIVAVEKFLDADHRGLAYTDAATRALSECLVLAGVAKTKQVIVGGSTATKAVVESRLRALKTQVPKGATLLTFVTTHGFTAARTTAVDVVMLMVCLVAAMGAVPVASK